MKNTVQDIRGITQLAVQANTVVTHITEGVHQSAAGSMRIRAGRTPKQARGISGLVYRNIHNITQLVSKSLYTGLAGLQALLDHTDGDEILLVNIGKHDQVY
jgi:hypothetical protein